MKKLILIIFCIAGLSFSGVHLFQFIQEQKDQTIVQTPKPAPPLRIIDVDALASRMKKHQDLYEKLRDDSLKVYASLHPNPGADEKRHKPQYVWRHIFGSGTTIIKRGYGKPTGITPGN